MTKTVHNWCDRADLQTVGSASPIVGIAVGIVGGGVGAVGVGVDEAGFGDAVGIQEWL